MSDSGNNNNSFLCYSIEIFNNNIKILVISFLLIFFSFYMNNVIVYGQKSDFSQFINDSKDNDLNIVAVGDFYCNDETKDTIKNIIAINPELIITTGDHVKDVESIKCWAGMSQHYKEQDENCYRKP